MKTGRDHEEKGDVGDPVVQQADDAVACKSDQAISQYRPHLWTSISRFMYGMTFWTKGRSTSRCRTPLRLA